MIVVETVLRIDRPAREVFAFVADHRNAPQWQKGLTEVRRVTDGPVGVGTEHVFVRTFAGRRIESRNRFVTYEPGHYVEFEFGGNPHGRGSYRADPTDGDCCVLTSRVELAFTGPGRLLEPVLRRVLFRDTRRDEATLKHLLEAGST